MNRPLIVAILAALLGFGFWVWLTGPGTSVPNAILALLCAVVFGRAGWWLVARGEPEQPAAVEPEASVPPQPRPRGPDGSA